MAKKQAAAEAFVPDPNRTPRMEEKFCPMTVGKQYILRTVTFYQIGRLEEVKGDFAVLSHAIWVADMGRFDEALKDGTLRESVPVPTPGGWAAVSLNSVVDIYEWNHKLPD